MEVLNLLSFYKIIRIHLYITDDLHVRWMYHGAYFRKADGISYEEYRKYNINITRTRVFKRNKKGEVPTIPPK